ncbi:hypothetical protein [Candidatus Albibeggiatoa sp. nov. NOAA]|uniref:hypothetical protein n=1 Tax=Candidatus Albibeggiatoa sp. nov. NOAA TaxID=3162724 RepID=UPI0032FE07F1|nr:hypothetical protein [Thiotrichaceae bacterium]
MTAQAELVSNYLENETILLQDWYQQTQISQDPDLEPIATFPSFEELKKMAIRWWQQLYKRHIDFFHNALCKKKLLNGKTACEWWQQIREESSLIQDFIIVLIDERVFSPLLPTKQFAVAVTLIVTTHFLDHVCEGCN